MGELAAKVLPLLSRAKLTPLKERDLIILPQTRKPVIKTNQRVESTIQVTSVDIYAQAHS
jgi:hypothetical protein